MKAIKDEISELESRLALLRDATFVSVKRAAKRTGNQIPRRVGMKRLASAKRKRPLSAERKASQQLQGQYLGYIRQVPGAKRAFYQKIAKNKGREAAIAAMKKALGR